MADSGGRVVMSTHGVVGHMSASAMPLDVAAAQAQQISHTVGHTLATKAITSGTRKGAFYATRAALVRTLDSNDKDVVVVTERELKVEIAPEIPGSWPTARTSTP